MHGMIDNILSDLNLDITHAYSGKEGLEKARNLKPDLILLDVVPPDLLGVDLCKQLKDDEATYDIMVIFVSGADDTSKKVRGFNLGAFDYVTKPFDVSKLCAMVRSALKIKALMDLLAAAVKIDVLTGFHNRRYFDYRLDQTLAASRRRKAHVGLVLIDVDEFKSMNDTHGHPLGDRALRRISDLIAPSCHTSDVACRYGGDEFALLLPDTDWQGCKDVVSLRLMHAVCQDQVLITLAEHTITITVGCACTGPEEDCDSARLMHMADKALYAAKDSGRNCLAVVTNQGKIAKVS